MCFLSDRLFGRKRTFHVSYSTSQEWGLPRWFSGEEFTCQGRRCRRHRLDPVSGSSPGEGSGNPLQCSCLENPVDRGAWWATAHGVTKELDTTKQLSTHLGRPWSWLHSEYLRTTSLQNFTLGSCLLCLSSVFFSVSLSLLSLVNKQTSSLPLLLLVKKQTNSQIMWFISFWEFDFFKILPNTNVE